MDIVLSFFLLEDNRLFLGSTVVLAVLFLLEVIGLAFGASLSHIVNANIDSNHNGIPDALEGTSAAGILSWMGFGRVPATIVIALFLAYFAISGFVINWFSFKLLAVTWPPLMCGPFAVMLSMLPLRISTATIARVLPKDFTTAVSVDELVGQRATIVNGDARTSVSAEARVLDRFCETHYVRVKPIDPSDVFVQGTQVYLDKKDGEIFLVSKTNQE